MKDKKIAIVIPDLGGGGAEKVALALANGFSIENHVRLVLFKREGVFLDYLSKDVELRIINRDHKSPLEIYSLLRKIRKNLKDRDVVISGFQLFTEFYTLLASINLNIKRISVSQIDIKQILKIKGYPLFPFKIVGSLFYRFFDICVCSSKGVKTSFLNVFNIKEEKVKVIYNPVFDLEKENIDIKLDHDRPIFITLARLNYQKRLDIMIKAFSEYRKKTGKGSLLILGEGELEKELKNLAKENDIENEVVFAGFKRNIRSYLERSDVFLLTSDFEGFGNVIVEAMDVGLPVISTKCPSGPAEILENGKFGILTPVDDIASLSKAMIDLASDKFALKDYSNLSLERAKDFSLEKILKEYKDVIDRL